MLIRQLNATRRAPSAAPRLQRSGLVAKQACSTTVQRVSVKVESTHRVARPIMLARNYSSCVAISGLMRRPTMDYLKHCSMLQRKAKKGGKNKRYDDDDDEYDEDEDDDKPKKQQRGSGGGGGNKEFNKEAAKTQFLAHIERVKKALGTIQLARAEASLLNSISVDGKSLTSMGQTQIRDPTTMVVTLHDVSQISKVVKAIEESNMGLQAQSDGQVITVVLPKLTAELRKKLVQRAAEYAENGRKSIRAERKKILDEMKKLKLAEDDQRVAEKEVQKLHDDAIKQIDQMYKKKEQDILR